VVSRLITALAAARQRAWGLAGDRAPGADGNLIPAGTGATIVLARPEKEKAAPAWKKTYGFHPLAAFAGHGAGAGGEALAIVLRAGNTGSNTASGHIEVTRPALAQLPPKVRRRVLIRTGSGGGTHDFLAWLASPSRRLHYPAGMTITKQMQQAILALPGRVGSPPMTPAGRRGQAHGWPG
jgi:DDE family transposase